MSYLDKYNELKRKRKQEEDENNTSKSNSPYLAEYNRLKGQRETSQPTVTLGDVFDRVGYSSIGMQSLLNGRKPSSILSQAQEEEDDRKWFEKGAFEDGYQFGDIAKTILGTGSDALEEFEKGVVGIGEKAIDFGASLFPYASSAIRNIGDERTYAEILEEEKAKADEFIKKDIINEEAVARNILAALPSATQMITTGGFLNPLVWANLVRQHPKIMEYLENDMEDKSVLGEKSEALVQSAGQLAAQYGLQSVGVPWFVTAGVTSFGGEMENALKQGATHEQAMGSAVVTAGAEVLSEKLFGGDLFTKKAGTDLASKWLATNVSNKAWRTFLKYAGDTAGEGIEEVFSEFMGNLGSKLYREESLGEILFNEEALDGYLESAIGGWVLGGGMSGINVASSAKVGTDYTTGLTANEQKVVETLYNEQVAEENKNGDVSQKRKGEIFDGLVEDMKNGRLSTDDIERILASDSHKAYQDLQKESDEFSYLYKTPDEKLSEEQRDRRAELKAKNASNPYATQLLTAQQNLSDTVFGLVKGDRLAESYMESSKRRQAFEADLEQYDENQRTTIQNAINSGVLNNTRRTHEFVDLISKISADKGVAFDFTNNERLKGSSFAIEGKTVNGFVTKDGVVTLNTNSKKALGKVVGHEITHVLEGTKFYDTLQEALFNYAVDKGEYYDRLKALREVYKGVEGYDGADFEAKVKNELAADLVGDYLFTDSDFVRRLSTEHRNVFQKMWDEIKYLCKIARAGSNEARELERVKKVFEDAYRAEGKASGNTNLNPTADPDIRFSLSKSVEETKDLVALHNLTEDKLMKSLQLGGLPMPSLAVTKADIPHSNFGDITLIFGRETIDPKANKKNKVYSADAWTPVFPRVEYEADDNVANRVSQKLRELGGKVDDYFRRDLNVVSHGFDDYLNRYDGEEGLIQRVMDSYGMKAAYLEDIGKHIEPSTMQEEVEKGYNPNSADRYQNIADILGVATAEEIRKVNLADAKKHHGAELEAVYPGITQTAMRMSRMFSVVGNYLDTKDNGTVYRTVTDTKATNKAVDEAIDPEAYETWVRGLFSGIVKDSGIYNNKDPYTPSGNRRSFKQTHIPVTLENIVKAMAGQNNGKSKNVSGFHGVKTLRASTAETFKSVDAMHQRKGRLQNLTEEQFDAIQEDLQSRLFGVIEAIDNERGSGSESNRFIRFDSIGEILTEIGESGKYEVADIQRVFQQYSSTISDDTALETKQLLNDIAQMPVNMFEAKPERVVGFDEAKVFVIPNNADVKLKQELLNRGYSIAEYDPNIEGHRQQVVNQFEEYKFSLSNIGEEPDANGRYLGKDIALEPAQDIAPVQEATPVQETAPTEVLPDAPMVDEPDAPMEAPVAEEQVDYNERETMKPTMTARETVEAKLRSLEAELENNRRLRSESAEGYDGEIKDLRAEYDAKKNKNTQVANGILRRIERLQRMKASTDAEYAKRISDLAQRANKLNEDIESGQAVRGEQKKRKHEEYFNLIKDLVGDTSTWADKKLGIAYKVNTLRRNLRDIVRDAKGKKDVAKADAIWDELQGKYNQHEAERNKEVNALVDRFSQYKITSAEDTYIQMLGELRHNPETTLTEDDVKAFYEEHKKHINTQKVDRVIAEARSMYDSLLERLNEVLREQGMKEIPRREGYFPHFKDEKQGLLGKLLNWKTQNNEIPTDIAGLTETFNPTRSWQSFNKHRMSDVTDYSFTKGFDSYVGGALDWVYHIEDIQKRRAFENYIRYVHSEKGVQEMIDKIVNNPEYDADTTQQMIEGIRAEANNPLNNFVTDFRTGTNTLAGKKSSLDRTAEALTNRKIYSTMTNLSSRVSANMVGGSVSSALTNFIPITQSWMEVDPKYSVVAMRDTIRSAISDDGTIEKSSFLTNRLRSAEKLHQTTWDKISDKVGIMMDAIDGFTANTVWRSKYLQNLDNGMSESEAIKKADEFAANVMADRSRGNQPTIFDSKNPLIKAFTAFQLEVNNQYGYMFKDAPTDLKQEGTGKLIKGYATAFVGAYVYNALYSALTGRDAAFDPVSIVLDLMRDLGWIGDEEDEEENPLDAIWNFAENVAEEIPFIAPFTGGGRIPISSAIPYDGLIKAITGTVTDISEGNWKNLTNEWLNPVYYLLPPVGGGQARKTIQGLLMFDDDHPIAGSYTTSGSLRYSVEDTPWNRVQAGIFGQWANKNAQTYIDQNKRPLSAQGLQELIDLDVPMDEYWTLQNTYKRVTEEAKTEGATDEQILSARYISSVGSELSSLQNVKESLELGLTPEGDAYDDLRKEYGNMLPDDVCAEMLEEVESRMDELANERAESYTDVTIDGEYAQVGSRYFKQDDDGDWSKMSDEQTTKYLVTRDAGDSKYADDGTNFYRKDDEGEWHKMGEDEVTKYVTVRAAGDAHYATNGEVHYRLEEGGDWQDPSDWTKISDKQLERQNEVTSALGITPEEYWANTDVSFIPMVKGEYEYAYDNPENYTVAKAVGGYDAYKTYTGEMYDIKADKDENGKSISGSRKEKILDYINGLDCEYGMKLILFKSEYNADDTYNDEIITYLNEREDISYEEMETILKELGFKVDEDGNITW